MEHNYSAVLAIWDLGGAFCCEKLVSMFADSSYEVNKDYIKTTAVLMTTHS